MLTSLSSRLDPEVAGVDLGPPPGGGVSLVCRHPGTQPYDEYQVVPGANLARIFEHYINQETFSNRRRPVFCQEDMADDRQ